MLLPQREVFAQELTTKPSSCSSIKSQHEEYYHKEKEKSRFIFSSVQASDSFMLECKQWIDTVCKGNSSQRRNAVFNLHYC